MKKVLLVLISALLILSMSGWAIAGSFEDPQQIKPDIHTGTINGVIKSDPLTDVTYVNYEVESETYTVVIPGDITLIGKGDYVETYVAVTGVTLIQGRYLEVNVTSEHSWNMVLHENNVPDDDYLIPYSMEYTDYSWNSAESSGSNPGVTSSGDQPVLSTPITLLQAHGNSNIIRNELTFTMVDEAPSVGEYYDKLTFTVSVLGTATP